MQPGEPQFQSATPDQENQVLSLEWMESLVLAQAKLIPQTVLHLLKCDGVGHDLPRGGSQGCYQSLKEPSNEDKGVLPSDGKIKSGKNKNSMDH